jgi:hypothetical protein
LGDITPAGFTAGEADTVFASGGWGSGAYGVGKYGEGDLTTTATTDAAIWHLDNFGAFLVGCCSPNDGKLYSWDGNLAHVATVMSGAPTSCAGVVVTPERFVVALAPGGDGRRITWPSQESLTDWTPTETNTAGGLNLSSLGELVAGRRAENETLLWTTVGLHALVYVGGLLVYGLVPKGEACGLLAPGAVAVVGTRAFWMGNGAFYTYDGFAKTLPCAVLDKVFGDFNLAQKRKATCLTLGAFSSIRWNYCSAASDENDRYVEYNYEEGTWTTGALNRTAGCDRGSFDYPIEADHAGRLYQTEKGLDHGGAIPFIESGPIPLGEGDQVFFIDQILPDEVSLGDVSTTVLASFLPEEEERSFGPFTTDTQIDVRLNARFLRLKHTEMRAVDWRIGTYRVRVTPAGNRGLIRTGLSGMHDGKTGFTGFYGYL